MSGSPSLGDILIQLGRLTKADAERALAHQREHGGYFGEALVELGIVSQGEIEWGLASQHDLPYVFPDPEAIDPSAAGLVTPDWALAHLTLPMMRTGNVLTIVVDSPFRREGAEELARRAGCEVRLALAAPSLIRDAIRTVYSRSTETADRDESLPCTLEEALARIAGAGADRFGISVRDGRASAWWDAGGTVHRRALDARWSEVLADRMDPPIPEPAPSHMESRLSLGGPPGPVTVRCLHGEGGQEILFRRRDDPAAALHLFTPPPEGLVSEVRLLARAGAARLLVTGRPPEVAAEVLPHLPSLLFEGSLRGAHLFDRGRHEGAGLGVRIPDGPDERRAAIEELRPFQLDIVTVALSGLDAASLSRALDAASVCLVLGDDPRTIEVASDAGVRWQLHLDRQDGGHLDWALRPLGR